MEPENGLRGSLHRSHKISVEFLVKKNKANTSILLLPGHTLKASLDERGRDSF